MWGDILDDAQAIQTLWVLDYLKEGWKVKSVSHSLVSDSLQPHRL